MQSASLGGMVALAVLLGPTVGCSGDISGGNPGYTDTGSSGVAGAGDDTTTTGGSSNSGTHHGGSGNAGSTSNSGGTTNSGGAGNVGNPGGASNNGGTSSSGGSNATGGTSSSGGTNSSGGSNATGGASNSGGTSSSGGSNATGGTSNTGGASNPQDGPPAGNPDGHYPVPAEAALVDTSHPDHVVGTGTPASCTADALISAVASSGIITFNCGPAPVTITLNRPAKVFNDKGPQVVLDGGGLVTLSGGGTTRILYMNTCDPDQVWTTSHCDNQDSPALTVQNLTFINANSKNETDYDGGGAIWSRGGRLKVINSRFFNNVCADVGPDVGGAGIRAFSQYNGLPVYVVNSTFGGADGFGNVCSNGGGISSIGVSWNIYNSLFSYNRAIGNGGNPAMENTPGGGSGGAIYNDGNTMTLSLFGTRIEHNQVNTHGSAIFFVTNDHTGNVHIEDSTITNNTGGSWYVTYPQISNLDDTPITVVNSMIQ